MEDILASRFGQVLDVLDEFGMCFLMLEAGMAWDTTWHKPCRKVCQVLFLYSKEHGFGHGMIQSHVEICLCPKMVHGERHGMLQAGSCLVHAPEIDTSCNTA